LIKLYIIAYLCYRFFSEFIRPEPEIWLGLTAYQWAAVALIPLFACLWIRDAHVCQVFQPDRIGDAPVSQALQPEAKAESR
jgi:hypothetical protein